MCPDCVADAIKAAARACLGIVQIAKRGEVIQTFYKDVQPKPITQANIVMATLTMLEMAIVDAFQQHPPCCCNESTPEKEAEWQRKYNSSENVIMKSGELGGEA